MYCVASSNCIDKWINQIIQIYFRIQKSVIYPYKKFILIRNRVRQSWVGGGGVVVGRCAGIGVVRSTAHNPVLTRQSLTQVHTCRYTTKWVASSFTMQPRNYEKFLPSTSSLYTRQCYINRPIF
jgi:hypothetical protein